MIFYKIFINQKSKKNSKIRKDEEKREKKQSVFSFPAIFFGSSGRFDTATPTKSAGTASR